MRFLKSSIIILLMLIFFTIFIIKTFSIKMTGCLVQRHVKVESFAEAESIRIRGTLWVMTPSCVKSVRVTHLRVVFFKVNQLAIFSQTFQALSFTQRVVALIWQLLRFAPWCSLIRCRTFLRIYHKRLVLSIWIAILRCW